VDRFSAEPLLSRPSTSDNWIPAKWLTGNPDVMHHSCVVGLYPESCNRLRVGGLLNVGIVTTLFYAECSTRGQVRIARKEYQEILSTAL
jgi:hypothetical protein